MASDEQNKKPGKARDYVGTSQENDFLRSVDEVAQHDEQQIQEDLPMGQRIRDLRLEKGLSMLDIARRTGLDQAYLHEIEQGRVNPPLGILVKLGKALDMKMGAFISSKSDKAYSVVRKGQRRAMSRYPDTRQTSYGYSYHSLAPDKANRAMEPVMVTLTDQGMDVEPSSHEGQEFVFVLEGEMELTIGGKVEVLGPGDSIYYDSTEPHVLKPHGKGPTTILAVLYDAEK
ncbi:helix-turn-helix domain-containing protein [Dethiosulfatarculus sandiegensis]|uniref:helix-turn-helix domain-containing protein n=1 Tax=Dethiosulfatarculus sandiegensis TaxID=1429043 RepID=UPI0006967480|nr:cupin domain-containing protein [Dethiosulfatarculus sandiegensis]